MAVHGAGREVQERGGVGILGQTSNSNRSPSYWKAASTGAPNSALIGPASAKTPLASTDRSGWTRQNLGPAVEVHRLQGTHHARGQRRPRRYRRGFRGGTKATVHFPQGHVLNSGAASGSVDYTTGAIPKGRVNAKAKTHYSYTFTKPGYTPGAVSYDSAVYRCDNYYGSRQANRSGCAIPEVPTAVSMVGIPYIDDGIRRLRSSGGHYGDPYGGQPLHWMINPTQEDKNRKAVCPRSAPPDMQRAGRTSCDEYPFASTKEGGTHLPANQREITWVHIQENRSQGGRITAWRGKMHVMDGDPFYVIV
ncbi:NucA/NucB deoxyribonuclease domain-containing protein [Streptomyces sp. NPDC046759]|uniref:NucA/NucB deoxyribonuclease domain-containing protein n=1 Tax=Streptomyces sp. NPDC046759 TaxID=3155019 RepID=UPI0034011159